MAVAMVAAVAVAVAIALTETVLVAMAVAIAVAMSIGCVRQSVCVYVGAAGIRRRAGPNAGRRRPAVRAVRRMGHG